MFFKKTVNPCLHGIVLPLSKRNIITFILLFSGDGISRFKESVHFVYVGLVPKEQERDL